MAAARPRPRSIDQLAGLAAVPAGPRAGQYYDYLSSLAQGQFTSKTPAAALASGGSSIWDSLKDLGQGALDVLSVPAAAVSTTAAKLGHYVAGTPDVSWKNYGGDFYSGYTGWAKTLENFGLDKGIARWAGMAGDIALDPTWALAVVPGVGEGVVAGKLAQLGLRGEAAVQAAARADALERAATAGRKAEELIGNGKLLRQFTKGTYKGAPLNPQTRSELLSLLSESRFARAEAAATGKTPILRIGTKNRNLAIPLTKSRAFGTKTGAALTKVGTFKMGPYARAYRELANIGRDVGHFDSEAFAALKQSRGLTDAQDAVLRTVMGTAGSAKGGVSAADDLIKGLKERGLWDDNMSHMLRYLQQHGRLEARATGRVTYRRQANWIRGQLGRWAGVEQGIVKGVERSMDQVRAASQGRRAAVDNWAQAAERGVTERAQQNIDVANTAVQQAEERLNLATRRAERARSAHTALTDQHAERAEVRRQAETHEAEVEQAQKALAAAKKQREKLVRDKQQNLHLVRREARRRASQIDTMTEGLVTRLEGLGEGARQAAEDRFLGEVRQGARNENISGVYKDILGKGSTKKGRRKGAPKRQGKMTVESLRELERGLRGRDVIYAPQGESPATREALQKWRMEHADELFNPNVEGVAGEAGMFEDPTKAREFANWTEATTHERATELLQQSGVPSQDAEWITGRLQELLGFANKQIPAEERIPEIPYDPDMSALNLVAKRSRKAVFERLEIETKRALEKSGIADERQLQDMLHDLRVTYHTDRIPGSLKGIGGVAKSGRYRGEYRLNVATAWLKGWFTVMNPAHYVLNGVGAYINDLIVGNKWHALTGFKGSLPKTGVRKIVRGVQGNPDEVLEAGGKSMTRAEWAAASRFAGLGHGYSGAEIADVLHLFTEQNKERGLKALMAKWNMDRENASRVWSWMNHMRAGDDMFTAGAKTLRAQFDYATATHFERNVARQLILFYTWFKNNLIYQGYGILARPGIYAAMNSMERDRPKYPGEPEWLSEAGGLYTPFGLLTFGNPLADIYKYDASWSNFRKNVLAGLTPWIRLPVELSTNQQFFTGGDIEKFKGQNVPFHDIPGLATALNAIGVGTPSRANAASPGLEAALPANLAYTLGQFTGPQGNIAQAQSDPNYGGDKGLDLVGRLSGLKVNQPTPAWITQQKARARKQKADATRKRTYETP